MSGWGEIMKILLYWMNLFLWMKQFIAWRYEVRIYRDSHVLIVMLKK